MNLDPDPVEASRYKKDFADSLSAIIGSRAIIFMIYPPFVFFTIFASSLSNAPICVYPIDFKWYQIIPEWNKCLFIRIKPCRKAVKANKRSWCSQFFAQFAWCRRCGTVENEETEEENEPKRFHYYLQNKLVLDCFQQAFVRLVAERQSPSSLLWKSALRGIDIFFQESRGIRWLLNLYIYVLTVGVLYYPKSLISTVWILVPYAFFISLPSVVFVGNLMAIDDAHLKIFNPKHWWRNLSDCFKRSNNSQETKTPAPDVSSSEETSAKEDIQNQQVQHEQQEPGQLEPQEQRSSKLAPMVKREQLAIAPVVPSVNTESIKSGGSIKRL